MSEEESLESRRNEYSGHLAGAEKRNGPMMLRLDFNAHVIAEVGKNRLEGFSLRIMERPEDVKFGKKKAEVSVRLTVEQWQDLIDAMKAELEMARGLRAEFEQLDSEN